MSDTTVVNGADESSVDGKLANDAEQASAVVPNHAADNDDNDATAANTKSADADSNDVGGEQVLTVDLSNPIDMGVKHPLQHRWKLWYDHPGKKTSQQSWGDHLRQIYAFDTVEDFWRLWNNIMPCSKLAAGSNYSLFKDGVEPKWEDTVNKYGGKWVVSFPSKFRSEKLDQLWLYTVLALIGETFKADDDVCGVVVSIRKVDKIAVWTRDSDETSAMLIGERFRQCLELPESHQLSYQQHNVAIKRNSSFNNPAKYQI